MPIKFIRESVDADKFTAEVCRRFLAAFPGQIQSIYLLGSRAVGGGIGTSDFDFGVVFRGRISPEKRAEAWSLRNTLCAASPAMLDLSVLDEEDLKGGVRPSLKIGKLIEGTDSLKDCPLKPRPELVATYAWSALYFVWVMRDKPKEIAYPLGYPSASDPYRGYEKNGIWVGEDEYRPGLSTLVNLVVSIANFRLAYFAGVFVPTKSLTVEQVRKHMPSDPWLALVGRIYELCRTQLEGRMPENDGDCRELSQLCRRVLEFENEFLGFCILNVKQFILLGDGDLRRRMHGFVKAVRTESKQHAAVLEEASQAIAHRGGPTAVSAGSATVP